MGEYRAVVRHVRYWRGAPHRWSTVYPFTGSASSGDYGAITAALHSMEQSVLYPGNSSGNGGLYEIALYDSATGGVPISVQTYFDPDTPGTWINYEGLSWPNVTTVLESAAEVAMSAVWPAGLSRTGKPVLFRKWFHSVPVSGAAAGAPDIAQAVRTALQGTLQSGLAAVGGKGLLLGRGSRLAAATPVVNGFYETHQMPRGRRRKVTSLNKAAANWSTVLQLAENEASKGN